MFSCSLGWYVQFYCNELEIYTRVRDCCMQCVLFQAKIVFDECNGFINKTQFFLEPVEGEREKNIAVALMSTAWPCFLMLSAGSQQLQ